MTYKTYLRSKYKIRVNPCHPRSNSSLPSNFKLSESGNKKSDQSPDHFYILYFAFYIYFFTAAGKGLNPFLAIAHDSFPIPTIDVKFNGNSSKTCVKLKKNNHCKPTL